MDKKESKGKSKEKRKNINSKMKIEEIKPFGLFLKKWDQIYQKVINQIIVENDHHLQKTIPPVISIKKGIIYYIFKRININSKEYSSSFFSNLLTKLITFLLKYSYSNYSIYIINPFDLNNLSDYFFDFPDNNNGNSQMTNLFQSLSNLPDLTFIITYNLKPYFSTNNHKKYQKTEYLTVKNCSYEFYLGMSLISYIDTKIYTQRINSEMIFNFTLKIKYLNLLFGYQTSNDVLPCSFFQNKLKTKTHSLKIKNFVNLSSNSIDINSTEFIRGFIQGCHILNIDHHNHLTDIIDIKGAKYKIP